MLFKQIGSSGKVQRLFPARAVGSSLPQGLIFKLMVQMPFPHVGKRKLPTEDKIQEMKLGSSSHTFIWKCLMHRYEFKEKLYLLR